MTIAPKKSNPRKRAKVRAKDKAKVRAKVKAKDKAKVRAKVRAKDKAKVKVKVRAKAKAKVKEKAKRGMVTLLPLQEVAGVDKGKVKEMREKVKDNRRVEKEREAVLGKE